MIVAFAIAHSPIAAAHDVVMSSVPENESIVDSFPQEIVLEFSGIPKPNFNTVAISNTDTKEVLFTGQPSLNQQYVSIAVPESLDPGPGNYRVGYQITSSDGHATKGMTSFTVAGDNPATIAQSEENPDADEAAPTARPDAPLWLLVVGGAVLLALLVGVAWVVARRR